MCARMPLPPATKHRILPTEEPADQRYDRADDEAGHDWKIETDLATVDNNVTRQPAKPERTEPRP